MILLELYVPNGSHIKEEELNVIYKLLDLIKSSKNIQYNVETLPTVESQDQLKRDILLKISVFNRIKIAQTQKSKRLYPQLVIQLDGDPITFYPQQRGPVKISIEEALRWMLNGKFVTIHDIPKGTVEKIKRSGFEYEIKKE